MSAPIKNNDWKTTLYSTLARKRRLQDVLEKRQKANPNRVVHLNDLINEAVDRFTDTDRDLEGSRMALAYGVGEKITDSLAVLSTMVTMLLAYELEQTHSDSSRWGEAFQARLDWAMKSSPILQRQIVKVRHEKLRDQREQERRAQAQRDEETIRTRVQKARADAVDHLLDATSEDEDQ